MYRKSAYNLCMSEVDYTGYAFSYDKDSASVKRRPVTKCKEKRQGKTAWIVVFVVLFLAFSATVLLSSVMGEEGILSVLSNAMDDCYYSVVYKTGSDYDAAREYATFIRESGKGGNIVKKDGDYYVVYATYPDKSDAVTVASRGDGLLVMNRPLTELDVGADNASYAEQFNALRKKTADTLYEQVMILSTEGSLDSMDPLVALISEYNLLKTSVDDADTFNTKQKLAIYVAVDTNIGRLQAVIAETDSTALSTEMWFQMYAVLT